MNYDLFLLDLDDTLLDFKASERLSFDRTLQKLGGAQSLDTLFAIYQRENERLWKDFEANRIAKDFLKVERFRRAFTELKLELDPEAASKIYLEALPETVVLIDGARELCEWLSRRGEVGIVTNGIQSVQEQRIKKSGLAAYIGFVCVSEQAGFAKPDPRFFDYSVRQAKQFTPDQTLMVGDRFDTDILGAHNFGIDCCWYNPGAQVPPSPRHPTYQIRHLADLKSVIAG